MSLNREEEALMIARRTDDDAAATPTGPTPADVLAIGRSAMAAVHTRAERRVIAALTLAAVSAPGRPVPTSRLSRHARLRLDVVRAVVIDLHAAGMVGVSDRGVALVLEGDVLDGGAT